MVLAWRTRARTKDVDAVFQPPTLIRELAALVAEEQHLPEGWLNDGAKGFVSARHQADAGDLPQFEGLRVVAPTAEYMLAMKCMASRIASSPGQTGDVDDIRFLVDHIGLESAEAAMAVVARYYPDEHIPPRAGYLLEEIFADKGRAS